MLVVLARVVATVDVTGLARLANALDVVEVAPVVEDAMLLVLDSKLVLAAAMVLAVCAVSVTALDATLDTTGATALNPEMEKLPPFKVESVFESDEDSTFVVAET